MSLIDQALKKTQSSLHEKNEPTHSSDPVSSTPIPSHLIKREGFHPYWLIAVLLLIGLFFGSRELILHFHGIEKRYSTFYSALLPDSFFHHEKQKVTIQTSPIVLDGTMAMGNGRVALINGNLYHSGDSVNGLIIQSIHYNTVTLENPNTKQIIQLTPTLNH